MMKPRGKTEPKSANKCVYFLRFALNRSDLFLGEECLWIIAGVVPCGTFFRPKADVDDWLCRYQQRSVGGREEKEMSFEEESRKCKASCPICGRGLCRAAPHSVVEIYCPKCKSPLLVSFENNGFSAKIIENTGEHKSDPGAVC
jgi:hypothetical protein